MRGSIRRRGQTWTAYWDVVDPLNGDRRQRTKGGFQRRKDAERHLASVLVQLDEGVYTEPSKEPLGRFMTDQWLPAVRDQLRPLTARRYEQVARVYVLPRGIGAVPLRALTPGHLNSFYSELEEEGLAVTTRRLVHSVIRGALRDAQRWGKVSRNVSQMADPPALPRSRAQSWTPSEVCRLLAHVDNDRLRALWRLAATTGMRRGELLGLTWRCVDFENSRLRVEQQLLATKAGLVFGPPKSRRSERTIALDAGTLEALRQHREVQILERDLTGPVYEDADLCFCDEIGRPLNPDRLGMRFVKLRKRAGIPIGSLHTLRHTAATLALTKGVPLHIVAARLGDDPSTILRTYAHLLPNSDEEAAQILSSVLIDSSLTRSFDDRAESCN